VWRRKVSCKVEEDVGTGSFFGSRDVWALRLTAVILLGITVASCGSTFRFMSAEEKRTFLLSLEERTLADLVANRPDVQPEIDTAVGHAVLSIRLAKVPFIGAGDGLGVVTNATTGERTYLKVGRLDVGGGLGVREYRLVVLFSEQDALEKLAGGKLELSAGVESGAKGTEVGTGAGGIAGSRKKGYALYQLADTGVSATATVRMISYSVLDLEE
jgi:lipid-binding SYLF domain-containing protein